MLPTASTRGRRTRGGSTAPGHWHRRHAAAAWWRLRAASSTQAVALLEEAAAAHESVGDPLGRARALLALGVTRRRAKQKRPAREALEAAAAAFEKIGAAGWAERARREIGRIGGRTRSDELTPAERRVADLVAQGGRTPRSPPRSSSRSGRSRAT